MEGNKLNKHSIENKLIHLLNDMEEIEDQLSEWLDDTNVFQILQLSRTEIRHSNFLAYLFSPTESHQLKDQFFKAFLKEVLEDNPNLSEEIDYFDLVLNDYNDLMVYREFKNIDILLVSENNKLVMAIENKIEAAESPHQLNKYQNFIEKHYENYTKIYIFLTPEKTEASNSDWLAFSYYNVLKIIKRIMKYNEVNPKIEYLITDYMNVLRREINMDERLQQICNRIYNQHKDALDLIFENKPDNLMIMKELYMEALEILDSEGTVIFDPNDSTKSIIRFQTEKMNKVFPRLSEDYPGSWGNHKAYFFEISNHNNKVSGRIKLAFTGEIEPEKRLILDQTLRTFDDRKVKNNWKWWTLGNWTIREVNPKYVDNITSRIEEEGREEIVEEIVNSIRKEITKIDTFSGKFISKIQEISKS